MKMHAWLCVATMAGVSFTAALAQEQQSAPTDPAPAPATEAAPTTPPAPEKPAVKRPAPTPPPEPGPPVTVGLAVAKQNNINVRAQASIKSEVVNRLKRGDKVEVLEIVEQKAKPNEPDKWARIVLPTNTAVWAHGDFIDSASHTVKPSRLNVRGGPSENYSIVGRIEKGTAVKEIERKGFWVRIEPPEGVYGFVAAHLLSPSVAPPVEIAKADTTPLGGTTPPEETAVPSPAPTPPPSDVAPAPADTAAVTPAEPEPAPETTEEEIKRVVAREGIVKRSVSIQAPTWFVLESPTTGKTVNYLFTPSPELILRDYFGQRVIVTGEEGLDERWPNTPVINVESIEVVP